MVGKLIGTQTIRPIPLVALLATLGMTFAAAVASTEANAEANAEAKAEGEADLVRGEQLYSLCTKCHSADGGGNSETLAPAIAGMPDWYIEKQLKNFKSGIRGLHPSDTGGLRMYPMSKWLRQESDQKALAAYVSSMPPTDPARELEGEGDAGRGAGYYAVCSACHGPGAEGNQGMGAPPLKGQSDWYLYSSIKKYKRSIRGSGQGDPFGAAMIGMVATLPDDNAILDVIAHIKSLEN